ncbi:MAG: helix-turn-helix transcriptional regulator, partial [Myxococcales bacterium]|nr:helix-turn-helix transcriptional regulator [Myxococcales bacterium]
MPDDKTGRVRDQILDEATRLFAAHGFGATSIQAVAEAVGIRKPSLLYHFGSKELLRDAVLERILARWNELLPGLLVAAAKEDRFDGVMNALTSFFLEDP